MLFLLFDAEERLCIGGFIAMAVARGELDEENDEEETCGCFMLAFELRGCKS